MKHRSLLIAAALAAATSTAACTTVAQWVAGAAQSVSSSTPTQVATYADAVLASTTVTKVASATVRTHTLTAAQLDTVEHLSEAVHRAFVNLKAAHDDGQSLSFAAINEALAQWSAYTTAEGIKH